jgi:hypothetical protein
MPPKLSSSGGLRASTGFLTAVVFVVGFCLIGESNALSNTLNNNIAINAMI